MSSRGPRRVYLSVSARNQLPSQERDADPACVIVASRATPIIPSARFYEAGWERFTITDALLPFYEPVIEQGAGSPDATIYQVACRMSITTASGPTFPFTIDASNNTLLVAGYDSAGGVIAGPSTATVANAIYPNTAALAVAVQAAVAAVPGFGAVTVAVSAFNSRLVYNPPAGMKLVVQMTSQPGSLAYGGECESASAGAAATSPNSCGLGVLVESPVFTGTSRVWWSPEDLTAPTPPAPTAAAPQQPAPYWWSYNPSWVAKTWETSLGYCLDDSSSPSNSTPGTPSSACVLGQALAWASSVGVPLTALTTRAPQFRWNATTQGFELLLDAYSVGTADVPATSMQLLSPRYSESAAWYVNTNAAYNVMAGFSVQWQPLSTAAGTGLDAQIIVTNSATATTMSDGTPAWLLTQDYPGTASLSPVQSIVVLANSMSVSPVQVIPTVSYSVTGDPQVQSTSNNTDAIMMDVSVAGQAAAIVSGMVSYVPGGGGVRLCPLEDTDTPVSQVHISIMWRHARTGSLQRCLLGPGGSFDGLLLFQHIGV